MAKLSGMLIWARTLEKSYHNLYVQLIYFGSRFLRRSTKALIELRQSTDKVILGDCTCVGRKSVLWRAKPPKSGNSKCTCSVLLKQSLFGLEVVKGPLMPISNKGIWYQSALTQMLKWALTAAYVLKDYLAILRFLTQKAAETLFGAFFPKILYLSVIPGGNERSSNNSCRKVGRQRLVRL